MAESSDNPGAYGGVVTNADTEWDDDVDIDRLLFGVKFCPTCGLHKIASTDYWHRDRGEDDGLANQCADCRNIVRLIAQRREREG